MQRQAKATFGRLLFVSLLTIASASAQGQSANGVWSSKFPMPPGANGTVYAMTTYRSNLIVGGEFTRLARIQARGLAKIDGQKLNEFGGGIEATNYARVT